MCIRDSYHPLCVFIGCLNLLSGTIHCLPLSIIFIVCLIYYLELWLSIVCLHCLPSSIIWYHPLSAIIHCLSSSIVCHNPFPVIIHCLSSSIVSNHPLSSIIHCLSSSLYESFIIYFVTKCNFIMIPQTVTEWLLFVSYLLLSIAYSCDSHSQLELYWCILILSEDFIFF